MIAGRVVAIGLDGFEVDERGAIAAQLDHAAGNQDDGAANQLFALFALVNAFLVAAHSISHG
jgi:hypothetical protein